jgi:EF hand
MNKTVVAVLACTLALAACSTGSSHRGRWDPNGTPRDENWHSPNANLLKYDANHDGTLTRGELKNGLKAEYDAYDVSHTNCLGREQVQAINQMRVTQDASQASPLVDWNQDNCIDFNEYSGALLSLFDTLDTNSDGQLSPAELNAAGVHAPGTTPGGGRGGHGHHHGGGGGGGGGMGGSVFGGG